MWTQQHCVLRVTELLLIMAGLISVVGITTTTAAVGLQSISDSIVSIFLFAALFSTYSSLQQLKGAFVAEKWRGLE